MFALIGRAITRWSFVEEDLSRIFMVCTGDVVAKADGSLDFGTCGVHSAAFYAVESFRGKLSLVDAAIGSYVSWAVNSRGAVKAEWAKLREKARKLSLKRNRLAHYMVLPGYDLDDGVIPPRLVPPIGSPGFYRETGINPGKNTLHLEHIRHMETAFCLLSDKLSDFCFRLARNEELFDIYAQKVARRIRVHSREGPRRAEVIRYFLSLNE